MRQRKEEMIIINQNISEAPAGVQLQILKDEAKLLKNANVDAIKSVTSIPTNQSTEQKMRNGNVVLLMLIEGVSDVAEEV